ncbi:MAG: alpha/beta fold hydrolase, partial [Roseobacter sp.]
MPISPVGQFVDVSGTRIHYITGGSGPPLILLHGASGHLKEWTFQLFETLTRSYRVLAFDRPGLGFSDTGPNTETLNGQ